MRECRDCGGWLGLPPKLGGDVGFVDGLLVEFFEALGFEFFALVLGEVGDVFGVDEVFFFGVWGILISGEMGRWGKMDTILSS